MFDKTCVSITASWRKTIVLETDSGIVGLCRWISEQAHVRFVYLVPVYGDLPHGSTAPPHVTLFLNSYFSFLICLMIIGQKLIVVCLTNDSQFKDSGNIILPQLRTGVSILLYTFLNLRHSIVTRKI